MISPRLRPRFEMQVPHTTSEALARMNRRLAEPENSCVGETAGNHIYLKINNHLRRIWSPQLNLEVIDDDAGSIIHGHFAPRSDIWTLVVAIYAMSAFTVAMGLLFAASQWMLNMEAWAIWPVLGALVVSLIVYILALIGQKLSEDQMQMLLHYVEEAEGVREATIV